MTWKEGLSWRGKRGEVRAISKVHKKAIGKPSNWGEHMKESHKERALGVGFASLTESSITWEGSLTEEPSRLGGPVVIYTCAESQLVWDWENIPECKQHQFPGQGILNHLHKEGELDPGMHA